MAVAGWTAVAARRSVKPARSPSTHQVAIPFRSPAKGATPVKPAKGARLAAIAALVIKAAGRASASSCAISAGLRCQLTGVTYSPDRIPAATTTGHSIRFSSTTATVSPARIPCCRNRWASRLDSRSSCAYVSVSPEPAMM